jgi:hypothetical protein
MTALMRTLAASDDVGKIQGPIRCAILSLDMLVMSVVNRD